jgi:hypothetical protein
VHRAHAAGLAGASVFRGVEGYGASSLVHTSRLLSLNENLPIAVVIVDTPERIAAFLPQLDEIVTEGLVTVDQVEVVRYVGRGGVGVSPVADRQPPDESGGRSPAPVAAT